MVALIWLPAQTRPELSGLSVVWSRSSELAKSAGSRGTAADFCITLEAADAPRDSGNFLCD